MADTLALALPLCGLIVLLIGLFFYEHREHRKELAEVNAELLRLLKATPPALFEPPLPPFDDTPEPDEFDEPVVTSPGFRLDEMMEDTNG